MTKYQHEKQSERWGVLIAVLVFMVVAGVAIASYYIGKQ